MKKNLRQKKTPAHLKQRQLISSLSFCFYRLYLGRDGNYLSLSTLTASIQMQFIFINSLVFVCAASISYLIGLWCEKCQCYSRRLQCCYFRSSFQRCLRTMELLGVQC